MRTWARILWIVAGAGYIGVQWWVVSAWPVQYSWLHHTVSDLGYTTCGSEQRPGGVLATSSPRHFTFNVGTSLVSLFIGAGAIEARRVWGRARASLWRSVCVRAWRLPDSTPR